MELRKTAERIIAAALKDSQPDSAVRKALNGQQFPGCVYLVAIGKAGWQMARTAYDVLHDQITDGIVVTKYNHSAGEIGHLRIFEAGHPVPDENSVLATDAVLKMVSGLGPSDTVLFLVSGGGSALFERPLISLEEMADVTKQLLASGADITEVNAVRKRLSGVKGGKFAAYCAPAKVYSIVLSDIIGDPLDMIASGPAYPDHSTCEQVRSIAKKYGLKLTQEANRLLSVETPKELHNVQTVITGSVKQLCATAERECWKMGIEPHVLTTSLCCCAREAGSFLSSIAQYHRNTSKPMAFIAGGETVVQLTGNGLGGRNQELALAAASGISGISNAAIFSVGSDGTDGPTDAAGGYVDGQTVGLLKKQGIDIQSEIDNNNSYYALEACGGLIVTGPTGTNVNDLTVLLLDASET